ncbi:DivIVA domain-containing protein [Brochothrix campestris]|uniref:Cell-division initiation protein DivIVA n=1 Tax=Brochothrix campestris FSL F6-1037 TaxID=1265861 RepID=W7CXL7_9LIST|nr:DivIVA domain-containing protein [Brochothrix campestris]EUJ41727.1 cell-division initiation protein DivIVA [Brochothrix campestris FSL F6-1037]
MPLSPLDIHNKEFGKKLRGYDEDEVNDFLEQVIKDYELVLKENKKLTSDLQTSNEQLDHFKTIESTLNKSLVIAQDSADETRRQAQKEAELIVVEAKADAAELVKEGLNKAHRLSVEIEELKRQSKVFRERLRLLVTTQLDLLEHDDWSNSLEYDIDVEQNITDKFVDVAEKQSVETPTETTQSIEVIEENKEIPAK